MTTKTLSEKASTAWKITKLMFWTGVVCFISGHLEATYLTGKDVKHVLSMVERGACGQKDLDNKLFWYNCRDSIYAEFLNPTRTEEQKDQLADLIKVNDIPKPKKHK